MKSAGPNEGDPPGSKEGSVSETLHAWRYFFWLLAFVLVVVVFYAEEDWRGKWLWQRYKHQMAARGEDMEAAAFVPPQVPDDQNFAETPFLAPLFPSRRPGSSALDTAYDTAARWVPAFKGERSNSWVGPRMNLRLWHAALLLSTKPSGKHDMALTATNVTLGEGAEGVLSALSKTEPVIEELRSASQRPYARFPLHYQQDNPAGILLPHLAVLKRVSQVLQLRAAAELALGRTDAAFDDVQLMIYMANVCRDESILISQLVRMAQLNLALQAIAEGMSQWSEPQLRSLEEGLGRFDFCADVRRTLEAERSFFGVGVIDYYRRTSGTTMANDLGGMYDRSSGPNLELPAILFRGAPEGWFYLETLNHSRAFTDEVLPIIDLPHRRVSPAASRKAEEKIEALNRGSGLALFLKHRVMSALMLPRFPNAACEAAFAQTGVDTAALACALERCRRARGEFPDSLDALAPQFVDKLPHDLITGRPLIYRRGQDGRYVLYSVGWNEQDDGGNVGLNLGGQSTERNRSENPNNQSMDRAKGDWVWRPMTGDW